MPFGILTLRPTCRAPHPGHRLAGTVWLVCGVALISLAGLQANPEGIPEGWHPGMDTHWEEGRLHFQKGREAFVEIPIPPDTAQSLDLHLALARGTSEFTLMEGDRAVARFALGKDKWGESLKLQTIRLSPDTGKGKAEKNESLTYRPAQNASFVWENLRENQLDPKGWHERPHELRIVRRSGRVVIYWDGILVRDEPASEDAWLRIRLPPGDSLTPSAPTRRDFASRFHPISIRAIVPDARGATEELVEKGGIPFLRVGHGGLDLRQAQWPFACDMPSNYFASYDSGPMFLHDARTPTLWAPVRDYTALHLLVRRTPDAGNLGDRFSARVGSFGQGALGGRGQILQLDYHASVPKDAGELVLTIPLTEAIAQDLREALQIQFNREIRLARRSPDPSRYEFRPLGLPPGIEILATTLEEAPISLRLTSPEPGHVFEGTGRVAPFTAQLHNASGQRRNFQIRLRAQSPGGDPLIENLDGSLDPDETREVPLPIKCPSFGYYALEVALQSEDSMLRRKTSFALLPPDTRKHRAESPLGTWTYSTPSSPDTLGSLLKKAGLRFGMGQFPQERARWGVQNNFEPKAIQEIKKYEDWLQKNPDTLPAALLMHEHSISADHVTRIPDAISGRKPYQLGPDEKKRFQELWDDQIAMAKLMRAHYPNVHLRLGNGPLPTKEEFLRAGFPAELFDSLGNEAGSFGRLPEAQPPDWAANNSSLWMDHQLLKAYGYDKPVTQCYEIIYPSTNPGNLDPMDQAAHFVRHILHSLVWGIPEIRFGLLEDVVSAYRFSNWGAAGLVHAPPEDNPKPSYVAVATLTRLLDGARFVRTLDTGSPSVYGVEFSAPGNRTVAVFWTLRGERDISVAVTGADWKRTDWQGNSQSLESDKGWLGLTLSGMPLYLSGKGQPGKIRLGAIRHPEEPAASASTLSRLDNLSAWQIESEPDPILENHNPLTPRRQGRFDYAVEDGALRVHTARVDGPEAIPVYGALTAKTPLTLPGRPTDLGIWIKGNSGWGRVIYELQDATGQKWTSIGASRKGEISEWMRDWLPAEFAKSKGHSATQADWNTNDVFGLSAINFDGWRYVRFPLPGNYPGGNVPWPANSQWRSDGDGRVEYPLKLTRLIFEMPLNILKLNDFSPINDPTIHLKALTVESNAPGSAKQGIYEDEY